MHGRPRTISPEWQIIAGNLIKQPKNYFTDCEKLTLSNLSLLGGRRDVFITLCKWQSWYWTNKYSDRLMDMVLRFEMMHSPLWNIQMESRYSETNKLHCVIHQSSSFPGRFWNNVEWQIDLHFSQTYQIVYFLWCHKRDLQENEQRIEHKHNFLQDLPDQLINA